MEYPGQRRAEIFEEVEETEGTECTEFEHGATEARRR
jgi:hypothetical protein